MLHPELVFPTWQGRVAWSLKERVAVHQASLVLTPSEASRRDVARVFRLNPAAIRVVPEAADPVFRPTADDDASTNALNSYGIPSEAPYFLYVGGLSPHKNLLRLIEAFALGAPPTTRLVLVGDLRDNFHTHVPELRALIEKLALSNRVIFTGFVPDDQLALLYGRALALVQPSLLEGFGLPPVEAMACGTPVLHSTAGSLPEVIAGAGLAFDPLNVQAQAEAIRRISADPDLRADLAWRALERAAHFNWSRVGDQLLGAFESLGTQRPRAASA
jgi:glycosyltransferase involved in cell wall biosynthesis